MTKQTNKTGGGPGSNQYGPRGVRKPGPQDGGTPPLLDLAAIEPPVTCDSIWHNGCNELVRQPEWSHGNHPDLESVQAAAADPSTPPRVLAWLATRPMKALRMSAASNPSTPPEILAQMILDSNMFVRINAASNPCLPPIILDQLRPDSNDFTDPHTLTGFAMNPNTPPHVLAILADDEWIAIRQGVAMNPSTPPRVLIKLADDGGRGSDLVHEAVAENPNTPAPALSRLRADNITSVRRALAANPSIAKEDLSYLIADEDAWVRAAAAVNPNMTVEILFEAALSLDEERRHEAYTGLPSHLQAAVLMSFVDE